MKQKLEHIQDLTKAIFDNSVNVARYSVKNVGLKIIIRIYNSNNMVVFGMQRNYNNLVKVCRLILEEQKFNGGKLYEQQQQRG